MADKELLQAIGDLMDSKLEPITARLVSLEARFDGLEARFDGLETKVDCLESNQKKTNLLIEQDISRKIDIIGEGHDFLKHRLNEALQMEIKRDRMELDIANLRMDVKKIMNQMDIA